VNQSIEGDIDKAYEIYYANRAGGIVYPTEFVVRTFLSTYPGLKFSKPDRGSRILDIGFGDGRNTVFLCDQGYSVGGIEITEGIVGQVQQRLSSMGHSADLRVGRNSRIPFEDDYFDVILACHCCYYCDEGESFADNMREYARVLKTGGWLVASVASADSYIFRDAIVLPDGSRRIQGDPYGNRNGYRLQAFSARADIEESLSHWYGNFSFGFAGNDYYGIEERLYWVVSQKQ
jgi:SAM-dependent methyltransferase